MSTETIQQQLLKVSDNSIFGYAIKAGLNSDPEGVIKMIKDQAEDNRDMIIRIIGENLLNQIEKYGTTKSDDPAGCNQRHVSFRHVGGSEKKPGKEK